MKRNVAYSITVVCFSYFAINAMDQNSLTAAAMRDRAMALQKAGSIEQAIVEYKRAAELQDQDSIVELSYLHVEKHMQTRNDDTFKDALYWTEKAAQFGNNQVVHNYALMQHKQLAKEQSLARKKELTKQVIIWYTKAAEQNWVPAQNNLAGLFIEQGRDAVDQEKTHLAEQAKHWFTKAAQAGSKDACLNLALLYRLEAYVKEGGERQELLRSALTWLEMIDVSDNIVGLMELSLIYTELSASDDGKNYKEKARACLTKAVGLMGKKPTHSDRWGELCYQMATYLLEQARYENALSFFALAAKSGFAPAYYNAGFICHKLHANAQTKNDKKKWFDMALKYFEEAPRT